MSSDAYEYVILTQEDCKWCDKAKALLIEQKVSHKAFDINRSPFLKEVVRALGYTTMPQVFHKGKPIGGYENLKKKLNA